LEPIEATVGDAASQGFVAESRTMALAPVHTTVLERCEPQQLGITTRTNGLEPTNSPGESFIVCWKPVLGPQRNLRPGGS
jgi:hypothetical protein